MKLDVRKMWGVEGDEIFSDNKAEMCTLCTWLDYGKKCQRSPWTILALPSSSGCSSACHTLGKVHRLNRFYEGLQAGRQSLGEL